MWRPEGSHSKNFLGWMIIEPSSCLLCRARFLLAAPAPLRWIWISFSVSEHSRTRSEQSSNASWASLTCSAKWFSNSGNWRSMREEEASKNGEIGRGWGGGVEAKVENWSCWCGMEAGDCRMNCLLNKNMEHIHSCTWSCYRTSFSPRNSSRPEMVSSNAHWCNCNLMPRLFDVV